MKKAINTLIVILTIICLSHSVKAEIVLNQINLTSISKAEAENIFSSLNITKTSEEYFSHELVSGFDVSPDGQVVLSLSKGSLGCFNIYSANNQFQFSYTCNLQGTVIMLFSDTPETNCQGLFHQIHKKSTKKGARSTVWLLTPRLTDYIFPFSRSLQRYT